MRKRCTTFPKWNGKIWNVSQSELSAVGCIPKNAIDSLKELCCEDINRCKLETVELILIFDICPSTSYNNNNNNNINNINTKNNNKIF